MNQEIKKYKELERYFNNSFEELEAGNVQNELKLTNNTVLIQNLEDSQSEIRRTFTGIYIYSLSQENMCLHWLKNNIEPTWIVSIVFIML